MGNPSSSKLRKQHEEVKMIDATAIVMTKNEEKNIVNCLKIGRAHV